MSDVAEIYYFFKPQAILQDGEHVIARQGRVLNALDEEPDLVFFTIFGAHADRHPPL